MPQELEIIFEGLNYGGRRFIEISRGTGRINVESNGEFVAWEEETLIYLIRQNLLPDGRYLYGRFFSLTAMNTILADGTESQPLGEVIMAKLPYCVVVIKITTEDYSIYQELTTIDGTVVPL